MNWKDLIRSPLVRAIGAALIIVLLGCFFNADGAFFRWSTHRDMLRQASVSGILACGMTIVILSGGIDLSVGSVLGLTAVAFSILSIQKQIATPIVIPLCLMLGACAGAVSGSIISRFTLQPFIVTLAMMVFARGLAKSPWLSDGKKISTYLESGERVEMPAIFSTLDSRPEIFGGNIATVTIIFLVCIALCWFVLDRTTLGRYIYALGGNETAAKYSGVRVRWVKTAAYALCGFFAAVAGICQAAQEKQGDPETGVTYELSAIAIVVIGGTSLAGGRGGILLTLVGTLTIGYLEKILSINAVSEAGRLMLTGLIIIAAVLFQRGRQTS